MLKKNRKNKPRISAITAIGSQNRTIGTADGKIPWHIPEDFKYFKEATMGHPIIMGRKTFESFGGRLLPGRKHIVITRKENYAAPDEVLVVGNLETAIEEATELDGEEIFIIGGGQIYAEALPFLDRLYLTIVHTDVDGPVKFPEYSEYFSQEISMRKSADENFDYEFLVLEK